MRGLRRAALGAAVMCALAGPAGAAIVEASFGGDWNGWYDYSHWSVDVVFDTSLATESAWVDQFGAVGHQLAWSLGDGPSPVISETVTLYGYKTRQFWMNFDGFEPIPDVVTSSIPTGFSILQSDNVFLVQGYGLSGPLGPPGHIDLNMGIIPFDQAGVYGANIEGSGPAPGPGNAGAQAYAGPITLTVLSSGTPEPATWAMMMLGFLGLGAALRRRRFQPA